MEAETSLTKGTKLTVLAKAEDAFVQSLEICMKLGEEVSQIESAEMRTRLYLNLGKCLLLVTNMSSAFSKTFQNV